MQRFTCNECKKVKRVQRKIVYRDRTGEYICNGCLKKGK